MLVSTRPGGLNKLETFFNPCKLITDGLGAKRCAGANHRYAGQQFAGDANLAIAFIRSHN